MKQAIVMFVAAFAAIGPFTAEAVVKLSATRTGTYRMGGNAWVPLNDLGQNQLSFNLPAAKKLLLTYSADCAVIGTEAYGLIPAVDLDIIVNGKVVEPTAGSFHPVFCREAPNADPLANPTHATIAVSINGKKGVNTVEIIAHTIFQVREMHLGYSALTISD